jgi:hypothetical protein
VLVSAHDRGVDHHVFVVGVARQQLENAIENAALFALISVLKEPQRLVDKHIVILEDGAVSGIRENAKSETAPEQQVGISGSEMHTDGKGTRSIKAGRISAGRDEFGQWALSSHASCTGFIRP